ncbi:hypothetical protein [Streptomyces rishiriensis]|uniref:Uncharacterized protein n=1 Tax=Streptomyces rishiriensis TaxID=68264 RepID=A0ABU0P398_STRRH|nr:hypothetical protein [Streptomyces rishiriensis]MDQ0585844.1 hypothetical protein [Streptomyces rishiriensis]
MTSRNRTATLCSFPAHIDNNASASQLWGVSLWPYVLRGEPTASASADEIVEPLMPSVERHIIGQRKHRPAADTVRPRIMGDN